MQRVKISYPRLRPETAVVELDLEDVRAARSIRVTYDFARDGWSISAPNNPGDGEMSDLDEVWGEVAFVDAWHEPPAATPPHAARDVEALLAALSDESVRDNAFGDGPEFFPLPVGSAATLRWALERTMETLR